MPTGEEQDHEHDEEGDRDQPEGLHPAAVLSAVAQALWSLPLCLWAPASP